ncbi:hypothetical protein GGS20DRAFT_549922 [Poronia punctata]|nr:hypothetical protein GGS20DRAFT_549922 [Poronia punctata]
MLYGLANVMVKAPTIGPRPKNVPPPTPVNLPQFDLPPPDSLGSTDDPSHASVVCLLQSLHRPTQVKDRHFSALGVHLHSDATAESIVPDPSCLPSASDWDGIDVDEAKRRDHAFRKPLSNGRMSPEARVYMERRNELSVANQAAFRTVRRIKPEMGKPAVRLGNAYEFFRQMELMATYWDDTSLPPLPEDDGDDESAPDPAGPQPDQVGAAEPAANSALPTGAEKAKETETEPERITYRTAPGSQMPAEIRHNLISAFVKLVAYDFGCNVLPPRVEPRLYLVEPPPVKTKRKGSALAQKVSYFSSGCVFISRTPAAREEARAGIIEGRIAAVSARNTTRFTTATESNIDFGRELVAALATAQLRAREGKEEKRFGEGEWWATAKRWGGGEGGPIGREVEGDAIVGDKDSLVGGDSLGEAPLAPGYNQLPAPGSSRPVPDIKRNVPFRGPPVNKKPRKTLSMYDRYRMVRPPSSNWDKKSKYEAIGKVRGSGYDDVFVFSSLFHHISILRVRVPDALLAVLDGTSEQDIASSGDKDRRLGWGKLEVWRSRWFDLLKPEERLEAMRLLWGVMAWSMRKTDSDTQGEDRQDEKK